MRRLRKRADSIFDNTKIEGYYIEDIVQEAIAELINDDETVIEGISASDEFWDKCKEEVFETLNREVRNTAKKIMKLKVDEYEQDAYVNSLGTIKNRIISKLKQRDPDLSEKQVNDIINYLNNNDIIRDIFEELYRCPEDLGNILADMIIRP